MKALFRSALFLGYCMVGTAPAHAADVDIATLNQLEARLQAEEAIRA